MRVKLKSPVATRTWILAAALLAGPGALAQQPAAHAQLRGTWTATVGQSRTFWGTWTAETSRRSPNAASGSWRLLSAGGEIVAEGTWSARKSGRGWQGTWRARVGNGRSLSGSWRAGVSDSAVKTFAELLKSTAKKYVAGVWKSGRYAGDWWLEGSPGRSH